MQNGPQDSERVQDIPKPHMLVSLERASQVIHMTILHTAEFCSTVELECWSQLAQSEVDMIWTPLDFQGEATVISSMQDSCFPTLRFLFLFVHPGWIPTYNNAWPQHKGVSAALDLLSLQREASFAYLAENPTVFAYELHKMVLVHSTGGMMGMLTIDSQRAQLLLKHWAKDVQRKQICTGANTEYVHCT